MPKQFLFNPDGSIPDNVNVQALQEAGIPLVMPTEMPRQSGMVAVEQEPENVNGTWKQVWLLQPPISPTEEVT